MGGNSISTNYSDLEDTQGVVFVKGIRLTDKVVDRMKKIPPTAQTLQSNSFSLPITPQNEPLVTTEQSCPILTHPSSPASMPPLQEGGRPHVPLTFATQETLALHNVKAVSTPEPPTQETVAISLPVASVTSLPTKSLPINTSTSNLPKSVEMPPSSAVPPELNTCPETTHFKSTLASEPLTETSPSNNGPFNVPPVVKVLRVPSDVLSAPLKPNYLPTSNPEKQITSSPTLSVPLTPASALEKLLPHSSSSSSVFAVTSKESVDQMESCVNVENLAPSPELLPPNETMQPEKSEAYEQKPREQITDELQESLQEELKLPELQIHQEPKEEPVKSAAEAQTKAQKQIQKNIQKLLEKEQLARQLSDKDANMKEQKNIQNVQLATHYWLKRKLQKLQEKELNLVKQELLYREQMAKKYEKLSECSRITAESFKKGLEDTNKRFRRLSLEAHCENAKSVQSRNQSKGRHQIKPVCYELQNEILKCYIGNADRTMTCSNIASRYMECVRNAKQNKKLSTGG